MHEELKREFEKKFIETVEVSTSKPYKSSSKIIDNYVYFPQQIWLWFESKLPKEVEIEKPWDKISIKCPACRKVSLYTEDNFCPNCGAKINWK